MATNWVPSIKPPFEECITCGGNRALKKACCPSERMRRKRSSNARCRQKNAKYKCPHCGTESSGYRYCCETDKAIKKAAQKERKLVYATHDKSVAPKHKCVDCGTPTPDRRCDKCREKWNAKHGVSSSAHSLSADWQGF